MTAHSEIGSTKEKDFSDEGAPADHGHELFEYLSLPLPSLLCEEPSHSAARHPGATSPSLEGSQPAKSLRHGDRVSEAMSRTEPVRDAGDEAPGEASPLAWLDKVLKPLEPHVDSDHSLDYLEVLVNGDMKTVPDAEGKFLMYLS
ncbi:hypothetical protein HGM15179_014700 [Zosterops borbonicus]|uniref:Uncharacterized protein n=1 Tax=Zosterops borbonicus TaxID=364589 RepID=A0A8K1LFU7_9PASS|nr:hypothetical protein HGM15179_014700 [Zosterops borbonicus]